MLGKNDNSVCNDYKLTPSNVVFTPKPYLLAYVHLELS